MAEPSRLVNALSRAGACEFKDTCALSRFIARLRFASLKYTLLV